ncbi:hypothetical protein Acsp03_44110 [Actinomadura sp. NBRC 104412]|nr:hypothetical protein Acsp03_44110 [Actinomadura sp. NBRC 104412]
MQRVHGPVHRHRPAGRHQRLTRDLTAEDPLAPLLGATPPKDLMLDLLKIEEIKQRLQ